MNSCIKVYSGSILFLAICLLFGQGCVQDDIDVYVDNREFGGDTTIFQADTIIYLGDTIFGSNVEVFHAQPPLQVMLIDESSGDWLGDQLESIEIGYLEAGTILIAQCQIRLTHNETCTSDVTVGAGVILSPEENQFPSEDNVIPVGSTSPASTEEWPSNVDEIFLHRSGASEIVEDMESAYVGLWANAFSSECNGNSVNAQVGSLVVFVIRP